MSSRSGLRSPSATRTPKRSKNSPLRRPRAARWAVRPAPGRALLLVGISRADALALARDAERLGFIMRANDSRRRIVACPGEPACGSGLIPRASSLAISRRVAELPDSGVAIHVSGCRKGCAHPARGSADHRREPSVVAASSRRGPRAQRRAPMSDPRKLAAEVARLTHRTSEPAHG